MLIFLVAQRFWMFCDIQFLSHTFFAFLLGLPIHLATLGSKDGLKGVHLYSEAGVRQLRHVSLRSGKSSQTLLVGRMVCSRRSTTSELVKMTGTTRIL